MAGFIVSIPLILGPGEPRARAQAGPDTGGSAPPRCAAAFELAEKKADEGRLVEASRLITGCLDLACGDEVWPSCVEESSELQASLPSIIPFAVDEDGMARPEVAIRLDGRLITRNLAGVAIPVDPGQHEVSFSIGARVFARETILATEGERSRPVSVSCPLSPAQQQQLSENARDP